MVIFALGKDTAGSTEKVADDPATSTVQVYYDADKDGAIADAEAFDLDIDMDLSGPPYNLYRITPDPAGPAAPPVKELIATNVDNLVLRYYDQNGNRMPFNATTKQPLPYGGTGSVLNLQEREQVRLVEVELLLRGDKPDPNYTPATADEQIREDNTVGTYDTGGQPTVNFTFTGTDAEKFRRRSYRTLITPRTLGAVNCGNIVLSGDPAICPEDTDVTATVLDRNGNPVAGNEVTFTLLGAPLSASLSATTGTTDALGQTTTTLSYKKKSMGILVANASTELDCEGVPVTLSNAISVQFNPGPAAVVYTWPDPDPDTNPATALFGYLPSADPSGAWLSTASTCRDDKYKFWAAALDECGNGASSIPLPREFRLRRRIR